jgi:hypothetical protein
MALLKKELAKFPMTAPLHHFVSLCLANAGDFKAVLRQLTHEPIGSDEFLLKPGAHHTARLEAPVHLHVMS